MNKLTRQDVTAYHNATWAKTLKIKNTDGEDASLNSGDRIIFGIRKNWYDAYLIKKIISAENELNGGYTVILTPEDMSIEPGYYYYDISVQTENGDFIKIVPHSLFAVLPSDTEKEVD